MKTKNYIIVRKLYVFFLLFITLFLLSCSSTNLQIAEQNFIYNGKSYTIRYSIQPHNNGYGNQLIGNNFIAADLDQDRIIDQISKGKINIRDAQKVYDYCIKSLESSGKIKEINKLHRQYHTIINDHSFIIKFFNPIGEDPFTELSITNTKINKTNIYIDKNANLNLDEILKGNLELESAQKQYEKVVQKGIKQRKLKLNNGYLLLK